MIMRRQPEQRAVEMKPVNGSEGFTWTNGSSGTRLSEVLEVHRLRTFQERERLFALRRIVLAPNDYVSHQALIISAQMTGLQ
jgi:hypothetical protein